MSKYDSYNLLKNHNRFNSLGVNNTEIMIDSLKKSKDIKDKRTRELIQAIESIESTSPPPEDV